MAQMQVTISVEMAEELHDCTDEEYRRQEGMHRTYMFMRPEKIKELTDDKGLLGAIIRSVQNDYLTKGG